MAMASDKSTPYEQHLSVLFPSARSAALVFAVVNVDSELRPERVQRVLTLRDNRVEADFAAADFQHLRVSVSSTIDAIALATRTLATFNDTRPRIS